MNIRQLAYQLYIIEWKHTHITPEMEMDAWKNYFEYTEDFSEYSFDDYLNDYGYLSSGTMYVCFEEFMNTEYRMVEYMENLFDNTKLFSLYLADIEKL